jgi:PAS domain S-box-containing protein
MKSPSNKKSLKSKRSRTERTVKGKKSSTLDMHAVPLYSDSEYESLLENSRDVIYRFDIINRKYTYVSPSSGDVIGIKPAVFLKKKYGVLTHLLHKEEKEFLKDHLRKIFKAQGQGKKSFYIEYRLRMPGGEYKWVADNHTIVYGRNKKPESVIGNITDISFRKNAQEELIRSLELQKGYLDLLSSVQNALPAHLAMLDKQGYIIAVNESWKSFAESNGLTLSDFGVGINYLEVSTLSKSEHRKEWKKAADGIRDVLSGRVAEFQLDYPCHSPMEQRWFRMICSPINKPKISGAVVMHINTTERKLAEVALMESEAQYRQLFVEDLTGNYIADLNGRVLLCNPSFAKMFGFKSAEDIWKSGNFNIFSKKKDLSKQISRLKIGEKIQLHERVIAAGNGREITVLENLAGRYDSDGKLMSIQGYMLDITGRKNAENALKLSEEQYRVLFYGNPLPMWIFDFNTLKFIAVNDSAVKHYGYSRKEFLNMTLYDIRPIGELAGYKKFRETIIRKKHQNAATNAGIWKHLKKNGEIIDVEITRRPVVFEGKEAVLILANDVTKRIKADEILKKRNKEINLLYKAGKELSSSLDTEKIYENVYNIISEIMPCDSLVISSCDENQKYIKCLAVWHNSKKVDVKNFPVLEYDDKTQGAQSSIIRSGKSVVMNDYDKFVSKSTNLYYMSPKGTLAKNQRRDQNSEKSALLVPMKLRGKVIGIIQVRSFRKNVYTEGDLSMLEALSTQLSAAMANALLYQQSQHEISEREKTQKELKKKTNELTLLYSAERELSSTLQTEKIYDILYTHLRKIIPCESMVISSYDKKENKISCTSAWIGNTKHDPSDFPPITPGKGGSGTQTEVIRTGKAFIRNDFHSVIKKNKNRYLFAENGSIINPNIEKDKIDPEMEMIKSAMFVPMKLNKKVIGVISVFSFDRDAYTQNDLRLLETLSTQVSSSTVNATLYRQAQDEIKERKIAEAKLLKRTREISLLYEAYHELTSTLKPSVIYDKTYRILKKIMPCDAMSIMNIDSARSTMKFVSVWQSGKKHKTEDIPEMKLKHNGEGGILTKLINNGYPEIYNDYYHDVKHNSGKISLDNEGNLSEEIIEDDLKEITRSAILVPMKLQSKVFGVLSVYSYKKDAYTKEDLNLLEALTAQLSAATFNAMLYEQAQNEIAEKEKAEKALNSKTREIGFLYEAQKELSGSLDMTTVYDRINKIVSSKMSCDSMIISSYDKQKSEIKMLSVWADGRKANLLDAPPIPLAPKGYGIQSEVIRSGESKLILNYEEYYSRTITKITYTNDKPEEHPKNLYSSAILVPMKIDGRVIGVIQVLSYKKNAYDNSDLQLLESLTGPITAATINASLYHQAQTEIIERSRKEKELGVIKKNLEEAQRIAHVGSWFYDQNTKTIINSAEISNILGMEKTVTGMELSDAMGIVHEEDRQSTTEKLRKAIEKRTSYTNEDRIVRPDGEVRFVKIVGEPIFDDEGEFRGMQGTMQDITDIKRINEELRKSLGEKELMLKEIHHRVKNNLQIVSSLLRLQSDKITDTAAIEYLKQSEQRVKSMALIHQQLYKTKDLARIDFGEYLGDLCTYLFFAYGVSRSRVDFRIEVKEVYFSIDTALPCGLIVNELVTNSIKHGFPGDTKGMVTICLHKDDIGKNHLVIKDDGKGAEKLDLENSSTLGMELVRTLIDQLEGEISVNTDSGTEIHLSFFDLS